jgi:hypothetical protein
MTEKHANLELWKSAPLAEINHPHPKNPRVIPDADSEEVRTLDASLEHDYFDPLIWNKRNRMWVSGHVRAWRMTALGFTHADVVVVDYDEETHLARMLAANAHSGKNDEDKLNRLIDELRTSEVDPVLAMLSALPKLEAPKLPVVEDEYTGKERELIDRWQVEAGQVWKLGRHTLACGDCDNSALIKQIAPDGWDVAVIDPPFERNDLPHLTDPAVVFGQAKHVRMIPDHLFRFERIIDKGAAHRSATVQIGHRHAFVIQCGTVKTLPTVKTTFPSIITCDERPDHRHQKDVNLLIEHLTHWTPPWQTAFDPFIGSGTTLFACEAMDRRGVGIEVNPLFVAKVLQRWQDSFGIQPVLEYPSESRPSPPPKSQKRRAGAVTDTTPPPVDAGCPALP